MMTGESAIYLLAGMTVGYILYTVLLIAAHCRMVGGIPDEARRLFRQRNGT
jgi:hypothetical protein